MKKGSKRALVLAAIVVGVPLIAIQFLPAERSNPARQTRVPASAEARAVLKRACFDCHSNETTWPWYSHVAPVSWLVAKDVREGRDALNFSTWNLLSATERTEAFTKSWEKVQQSEMPPWFYLPLHPSAKLSPADRAVLQSWASSGGVGSSSDAGSGAGATSGTGAASGEAVPAAPDIGTGTGATIDFGTGADAGVTNVTGGTVGGGDGDGDGDGDHDGDGDGDHDGDHD